jgi:hypothetical protein
METTIFIGLQIMEMKQQIMEDDILEDWVK